MAFFKRASRLSFLTLALATAPQLYAQDGQPTPPLDPALLKTILAEEAARVTLAGDYLRASREFLGLDSSAGFRFKTVFTDEFGETHSRFQQTYYDVRVLGGDVIVLTGADGRFGPLTHSLKRGIGLNTEPLLSESGALAIAHADLSSRGEYAYTPLSELVIRPDIDPGSVDRPPPQPLDEPPLWVSGANGEVRGYDLVYQIRLSTENDLDGFQEVVYLVDALTGEILGKRDNLHTAGAKGTGRSQYSGRVTLETNSTSTGFELRDMTRGIAKLNPGETPTPSTYNTGLGNATFDFKGLDEGRDLHPGIMYTNSTTTWGDGNQYAGVSTDATGQTAAVEAHYGLQVSWDFFRNVLGRHGIDNRGSETFNRVHAGTNFINAFWSDRCFCMTYGDGNPAKGFTSVTSIDVAGHEMSHGVDSTSADLNYGDDRFYIGAESGGLNESNSDILGTMVEYYQRGGGSGTLVPNAGGNFTIGEQLGTTLRWMHKPSLDGLSPDAWYPGMAHDPRFASSSYPNGGDPHLTSGPNNRMFYFLSQGANENPTHESYTLYLPQGMTGIGNDKASRIWYRALTTGLVPTSNYHDARTAAIRAARKLYGRGSGAERAVWNAYAGIHVGAPWPSSVDRLAPLVFASASGSQGTITLSATAGDSVGGMLTPVGVSRVEFYVDGQIVATSTDRVSPTSVEYRHQFDSTTLENGNHLLMAMAFDASGNMGQSTDIYFQTRNSIFNLKEMESNDNRSSAQEITSRTTKVSGHISHSLDQDHFKVYLPAYRTLNVLMTPKKGSLAPYDLTLEFNGSVAMGMFMDNGNRNVSLRNPLPYGDWAYVKVGVPAKSTGLTVTTGENSNGAYTLDITY